jgi:hypothetical protein
VGKRCELSVYRVLCCDYRINYVYRVFIGTPEEGRGAGVVSRIIYKKVKGKVHRITGHEGPEGE